MRNYSSEEVKSWSWVKRQDYILASNVIGDGKVAGWKFVEKFPIEKIKYNSENYPNQLDHEQVLSMTEGFYPSGFYPIRIDKQGNLKDGLHRLTFAIRSDLKFIDVFVE